MVVFFGGGTVMQEEAQAFREAVAEQVGARSGHGKRYGEALRQRAVEFVAKARAHRMSVNARAKLLGVSEKTLYGWLRAEHAGAIGFRRVEVSSPPWSPSVSTPILISPSSWRVEGLGAEQLVALLRAL